MQPKPLNPSLTRESWVRLAILADLLLIAFLLASGLHARWSIRDWQTPVQYGSEGGRFSTVLAGVKAATQGHYLPFISQRNTQFGAPHGADWGGNPAAEQAQVLVAAIPAKIIGVFTAVNLLVIMAHVLAVFGFYAACRALGYSWEWSGAGALLFGFASFIFAWGEHHLTVAFVAHIPLMLLVFRWAFNSGTGGVFSAPEPVNQRGKKKPRRRGSETPETVAEPVPCDTTGLLDPNRFYWALGIAVFTGFNHDCYTNLLVQLMALAALYHAYLRRWVCARRTAIVALVALAVSLFLNTLSGHRQGMDAVSAAQAARLLESSGFRLADLFIPSPSHWLPSFARWGERYSAEVVLKTETPTAAYLGVVGIAAFLWLLAASVRSIGRTRPERPPMEAYLIGALVVYATVGGAGFWTGSLGLPAFTSGNRIAICIFALVLMYAVHRLSALTAGWKTAPRLAVAGAIVFVGLWDQVPRGLNARHDAIARTVESDRAFTREMESRLTPNAMVFQLPAVGIQENSLLGEPMNPVTRAYRASGADSPENTSILPYDHFRPSFYSNTLRFSSGDLKAPRNAWQSELALLEPTVQMNRLESYGFGAVYLNLPAMADRGEAILKTAEGRGAPVIHSPAGDLACVILKPGSSPVVPPTPPYFGTGWYEQEADGAGRIQHYCEEDGELVLTNTNAGSADYTMTCLLVGLDHRAVRIATGETVFEAMQIKPGHALKVEKKLTLRPGANHFTFFSDRTSIPTTRGPVSFILTDLQVARATR